MNFDLTRQSFFSNLFYILLLSILFWGGWVLAPDMKELTQVIPSTHLGTIIDNYIRQHPITGVIAASLLMFYNSLLVTRICIKNVVFLERSYMPALIYVVVSAGYFNSAMALRPLLVSMLLLWAANRIFRSYKIKTLAAGRYLSIGVLLGLAAVLYAPAIALIPLVFVGLFTFRLFNIKEWIAAIAGVMFPMVMALYIIWIQEGTDFGTSIDNFIRILLYSNPAKISIRSLNVIEWSFIATLCTLFTLSIISITRRHSAFKFKPMRVYMFFVCALVISAAVLLGAPCGSLYQLPIVATPLAVIIPVYFNGRRPTFWTNFLYALLIGCSVVLHIIPALRAF